MMGGADLSLSTMGACVCALPCSWGPWCSQVAETQNHAWVVKDGELYEAKCDGQEPAAMAMADGVEALTCLAKPSSCVAAEAVAPLLVRKRPKLLQEDCPAIVTELLACCHGLTTVGGQLVGDPMDRSLFSFTEWLLEEDEGAVKLSPPASAAAGVRGAKWAREWRIVHRFDFNHVTARNTVVAVGPRHMGPWVFTKGAPETVKSIVEPSTVPTNFLDVVTEETRSGNRVVALAARPLSDLRHQHHIPLLKSLSQQWFERGLSFLGLAVLSSSLKEDTVEVIDHLHKSNMRCIIMSGDHMDTAGRVAYESHIAGPQLPFLHIDLCSAGEALHERGSSEKVSAHQLLWQSTWRLRVATSLRYAQAMAYAKKKKRNGREASVMRISRPTQIVLHFSVHGKRDAIPEDLRKPNTTCQDVLALLVTGEVVCGVSGRALQAISWAAVEDEAGLSLLETLMVHASFFARMKPNDKEKAMELLGEGEYQSARHGAGLSGLGYCTLHVGDGANDISAFKAASVGMSLCESETSVAAPLTSTNSSIRNVVLLIAEGRCSLTVQHAIAHYIMCYAWIQVLATNLMYREALVMDNQMYLFQDLGIATSIAICMSCTNPRKELDPTRPPSRLMRPEVICFITMHMLLITAFQVLAMWSAHSSDGFVCGSDAAHQSNSTVEAFEPRPTVESTTMFLASYSQLLICAVAINLKSNFQQAMYRNIPLMVVLVTLTTGYLLLLFMPNPSQVLSVSFADTAYSLRFKLLGLSVLNLLLAVLGHLAVTRFFCSHASKRQSCWQARAE